MLRQYIVLQTWMRDVAARRTEGGATAVEYGLLVVLIAAIIVATVALVGKDVLKGFQTVETALP